MVWALDLAAVVAHFFQTVVHEMFCKDCERGNECLSSSVFFGLKKSFCRIVSIF